MTDTEESAGPDSRADSELPPEPVPAAIVERRGRFSLVWLVPLVAAVAAGWLAYEAWTQQGPTITISFGRAEGLEPGKTKIKYKDVEVGQVEAISLSSDLQQVIVSAQLIKQAAPYLTENTRFWVVRARITASETSGLATLFSGAYIGMDPVAGGKPSSHFNGLETPPVVTTREPGRHFLLRAKMLGSVNVGSPVYYRRINVGQVVAYELAADGETVDIRVFVRAPHHELIRENTRFWNASGLNLRIDAEGMKVDTESAVALLVGGVAFDTPKSLEPSRPAKEGAVFDLFESRAAIHEKRYMRKAFFMAYFDGSVRGLSPGAPVEFRGIKIGQVLDFKLEFHKQDTTLRIPVLMEMEPDRISYVGGELDQADSRVAMETMIRRGLRAQLKSASLLTGQLFVDLDFHPEAPPGDLRHVGDYLVIPTLPTPIEEITRGLSQLLERLQGLPLEGIAADLQATVRAARELVEAGELQTALRSLNATLAETEKFAEGLNQQIAPGLAETLTASERTMQSADRLLSEDSPLQRDAARLMRELSGAARSIKALADYLERHPEALLYGKGGKR